MSSSSRSAEPRLYVLLPVHNRRQITERLVRSLAAQTMRDFHLVLLDDGSTDGTVQMVAAHIRSLAVVRGDGDWWWAGALQQGLDWLAEEGISPDTAVLITNDDGWFEPDFLEKGLAILARSPHALLQATIRSADSGEVIDTGIVFEPATLRFRPPAAGETPNCLTTNGLFARWGDLKRIGGFHPLLLPHYLSDYEFTIRAGRKGLALRVDPALSLRWDQHSSGFRSYETPGFRAFLGKYFSPKSVSNPLYWSSFVLLVVPARYLPRHLIGIWRGAIRLIAKKFRDYLRRRALRRAVTEAAGGARVVVGAGGTRYDGWISVEYPALDVVDPESMASLLPVGGLAAILAEHVWEHLSEQDGERAARNCLRYLRAGGHLRIAVPDGLHPDPAYIEGARPGGTGAGAGDHKVLYTFRSLPAMLERAGFRARLLEWFDEQGRFRAEPWQAADGFVLRSTRHDPRNGSNPTAYTSLIVDAVKEA